MAPLRPNAAAFSCHPPPRSSNGFTAKQLLCFGANDFQISFHWFDIWLENVPFETAWVALKRRSRLDGGKTFQSGVLAPRRRRDSPCMLLWLGSLLDARRSVLPLPRRHCALLPRKQTVSKTNERLAANRCW